ncbi:RICIN domain-containing protein [Streptomyces sp. 796.1]|uniref:RICIN domain-containing protein n=1 Tax=Streptomyces sp. 796.1 TaxID=3163029 RepID=UPI0039C9538E
MRRLITGLVAAGALVASGVLPAVAADSGTTSAPNRCEQKNTYRNVETGYYLDVKGAGGSGADVITWRWNGKPNQYWCMERASEGGWYFHPSYNLGLCMDSPAGGDGAPVIWNCKGNENQRFNVGGERIQLRRSGKYVIGTKGEGGQVRMGAQTSNSLDSWR